MSLKQFKQQFSDLLRPNYFEILIAPPAKLNAKNEILSFLCSATDFPFETISTMEMVSYGRKRMIATGVDFDPINITFLLDSGGKVLDFFQKWKMLVIGDDFKVDYYNNYIGNIEIYMLDRQKKRIFGVLLTECYPVNRNNLNFAHASTDTLTELTVSFVYANAKYNMNNTEYPSITDNNHTKFDYSGKTYQSSQDGIDMNNYLSKFGSDKLNIDSFKSFNHFDLKGLTKNLPISKTASDLLKPFTKKINKFQNSIDTKINHLTSSMGTKYRGITKTVNNITSPFRKIGSSITQTINKIFKF